MSFARFSPCLDTYTHEPPLLLRDARVDVDSLTGIHNVFVKFLFLVNINCIHKEFLGVPEGKYPEDSYWLPSFDRSFKKKSLYCCL